MQTTGGLSALTGMGGTAPPPSPAGPPDAWDHARVQKALDIIEQNPGISAQMMQTIMSEALGPAQAQIDQRRTRREGLMSDAFGGLTSAALSGAATPEVLGGLASAYQSMSPQLQKPGPSERLSDVVSSLGPVASGLSQTGATAPDPLDAASFDAIDTDVQSWAIGKDKQPDGQPYGLHEATLAVIQPLRAQGYSEEDLARVAQYVAQRWKFYGGPERPGGGY